MSADKKKMGRPYREGIPRDERVMLRLTKAEKEEIQTKAKEKDRIFHQSSKRIQIKRASVFSLQT